MLDEGEAVVDKDVRVGRRWGGFASAVAVAAGRWRRPGGLVQPAHPVWAVMDHRAGGHGVTVGGRPPSWFDWEMYTRDNAGAWGRTIFYRGGKHRPQIRSDRSAW